MIIFNIFGRIIIYTWWTFLWFVLNTGARFFFKYIYIYIYIMFRILLSSNQKKKLWENKYVYKIKRDWQNHCLNIAGKRKHMLTKKCVTYNCQKFMILIILWAFFMRNPPFIFVFKILVNDRYFDFAHIHIFTQFEIPKENIMYDMGMALFEV